MSGETSTDVSAWTIDSLKEYIERRFIDSEKAVDAAFAAQKEAVLKAESATERRFESVNEFRQTLADQTGSFMPRAEANARIEALAEKIDAIATRLDRSEGRSGGATVTLGYLFAAAGFISAVVAIVGFLTTR